MSSRGAGCDAAIQAVDLCAVAVVTPKPTYVLAPFGGVHI
jgi:hypothetical protein